MLARLTIIWTLLLVTVGCGIAAATDPAVQSFQPSSVRVRLTISDAKFKVGQPIPYEIEVSNVGHTPVKYASCWQWRIMPGYSMEVFDKDGKALPSPTQSRVLSILCGLTELKAGQLARFRGFLNQWAILDTPGAYRVRALWSPYGSGASPKAVSAPVAISIEKPTYAERDSILADARRQLKNASTLDEMQDAIWALAYTLDVRAIPDLVSAGQDVNVSQEAENALLRFSDKGRVQEELLKELGDHGPTEPLAYALSHFKIPADKSLPLLKQWLQSGTTEQRAAALLALSMIPERYADKSLRELIIAQTSDKDPTVRHHAVLAIGNGGFGDTLDIVMKLANDEPDVRVREQAIVAVGWHKDDRAIPLLKGLAKDSNAAIKRAAVDALKNIGSPAATAALAECCADPSRKPE